MSEAIVTYLIDWDKTKYQVEPASNRAGSFRNGVWLGRSRAPRIIGRDWTGAVSADELDQAEVLYQPLREKLTHNLGLGYWIPDRGIVPGAGVTCPPPRTPPKKTEELR